MKKIVFTGLLLIGFFSCTPDEVEIRDAATSVNFEVVFENNKSSGINLIYMGDAYLESDLDKENGIYRQQALRNIDVFFETYPFSKFKEDYNAYIVYTASEENVVQVGGVVSNTAFGAKYTNSGTPTVTFTARINLLVKEVTGGFMTKEDLVLMSVNNTGGGSAQLNGGIAVFGNGNSGVMMHEVGHAFAGLADEYSTSLRPPADPERYPNLDNTENLDEIKWKRFIGLEGYENVGAFEGGGYVTNNIWRPEEISIMKSSGVLHFNAPSREVIVKKINEILNRPCSFEDFLVLDRANMDRKNKGPTLKPDSNLINCGID